MKKTQKVNQCPICNSEIFAHYLDCKDYTVSKEVFRLMQCSACSLVITSPRPEMEFLGDYYASEDYVSHTETKKGLINRIYLLARKYALGRKKKLLNTKAPAKGNLLDYGCGTGAFLHTMGSNGWQVTGVEPDEGARKLAASRIGKEILTPEHLVKLDDGSFDIITLWHVLEHVPEPVLSCKEFYRLLKPGGKLILALPNHLSQDAQKYRGAWAAYDVPRHLFHFNSLNIKNIANKIGFSKMEVLPMKMDAFYISWLSEKYLNHSMAPIRALISGFNSNLFAGSNPDKGYSSQLYILSK
jgi:2-polyprenyl-3-methyl-5-hydroxy-6-metoxy-1,4-benzoquinol methylase